MPLDLRSEADGSGFTVLHWIHGNFLHFKNNVALQNIIFSVCHKSKKTLLTKSASRLLSFKAIARPPLTKSHSLPDPASVERSHSRHRLLHRTTDHSNFHFVSNLKFPLPLVSHLRSWHYGISHPMQQPLDITSLLRSVAAEPMSMSTTTTPTTSTTIHQNLLIKGKTCWWICNWRRHRAGEKRRVGRR